MELRIVENIEKEQYIILGRFTFLWNLFERSFYDTECNETAIIERTECYEVSKKAAFLTNELVNILVLKGDFPEGLQSEKHKSRDLLNIIKKWYYREQSNVYCVLLSALLFRIRCHTFHGVKTEYAIKDQMELFSLVNEILYEILIYNKKYF